MNDDTPSPLEILAENEEQQRETLTEQPGREIDWQNFYAAMAHLIHYQQLAIQLQHENGRDTIPVLPTQFLGFDGVTCTIVVHTNRNAYDFWRGIYGGKAARDEQK